MIVSGVEPHRQTHTAAAVDRQAGELLGDQGGDPDRLDNLRGSCAACHRGKTAEETSRERGPDAAA
jgi:hypothetical protein